MFFLVFIIIIVNKAKINFNGLTLSNIIIPFNLTFLTFIFHRSEFRTRHLHLVRLLFITSLTKATGVFFYFFHTTHIFRLIIIRRIRMLELSRKSTTVIFWLVLNKCLLYLIGLFLRKLRVCFRSFDLF